MRANPGGTIGPKDVIGRDEFIAQLWEILKNQSLVLTSERRIGKTCVITKMRDEVTNPDFFCVLRDIEGLRSPQEFVEHAYEDIESLLPRGDRARLKAWQLLSKLGGTQIGDIKLPHLTQHWKNLLEALLEDLFSAERRVVVFFWDELPLFINNVRQDMGEPAAMEVLDVLRSLRQRHTRLRMVFTGSVGLHQVVKALRAMHYANAPTNDMRAVEVCPLHPKDGARLASLLIEGEGIETGGDPARLAREISEAAGNIPYYIHHVVARMKLQGPSSMSQTPEEHMDCLISDPNDPADFRYYRTRLHAYYGEADEAIALAALDALAFAVEPLGFDDLLNGIRHQIPTLQQEMARETLQLMMKDHYIARRRMDGKYEFRYQIVRRWWAFDRR
jgi:hypothetical protein